MSKADRRRRHRARRAIGLRRDRDGARVLVLRELGELLAGIRAAWSARAVGTVARLLERRHRASERSTAQVLDWTLDWLRLVAFASTVVAGVDEVRVLDGWVERTRLGHVTALVSTALEVRAHG
jgi:hypothetical protein